MNQGRLRISDLRGEVLGGQHTGELRVDFTGKLPEYSASGAIDQLALRQLGDVMHDPWISGTATMNYKASAVGLSAKDLFASATAALQVDARDATLTHVSLPDSHAPLRVRSLAGRLVLRHGVFDIAEGKLGTATGIYQLSGTASLGRVLDVKLVRDGGHSFNVSGSLDAPNVSPTVNAEARAALKP